MPRTNKRHPKINREALIQWIAAMKAMKRTEHEEVTQKEAVEIATDTVAQLLGLGYPLAEVVDMMRSKFGLTIGQTTVRSYMLQAKAANEATAVKKPATRRGREAKPLVAKQEVAAIEAASSADGTIAEDGTDLEAANDSQMHDQTDHGDDDPDARNADVGDAGNDGCNDNKDDIAPIDAVVAQFALGIGGAMDDDPTPDVDAHLQQRTGGRARGPREVLPPPTYRACGGTT